MKYFMWAKDPFHAPSYQVFLRLFDSSIYFQKNNIFWSYDDLVVKELTFFDKYLSPNLHALCMFQFVVVIVRNHPQIFPLSLAFHCNSKAKCCEEMCDT